MITNILIAEVEEDESKEVYGVLGVCK